MGPGPAEERELKIIDWAMTMSFGEIGSEIVIRQCEFSNRSVCHRTVMMMVMVERVVMVVAIKTVLFR